MYNIFKRIQHRAVVCTSNLGDGGNETIIRGLVCGHAYSLLLIDEVELVDGEFQRLGKGLSRLKRHMPRNTVLRQRKSSVSE